MIKFYLFIIRRDVSTPLVLHQSLTVEHLDPVTVSHSGIGKETLCNQVLLLPGVSHFASSGSRLL